jgi:Skp family chaperone for outer membrane proteins
MNNWLRKIVPGLLLLTLLGGSASAQTARIATVDLRKLFDKYWKTQQANDALKDRAADMEKEHKNLLDDWKKAKDEYSKLLEDANNQALAAEERDRRKKGADDKLKSVKDLEETITQYERTARTTIDEQKKRMRDNIVDEIRTVLNAKAKSNGFTLVLDTAAESINNTPIVLFTNNDSDLTDEILKQLNINAPAPAAPDTTPKTEAKPEEKKGDKKSEKKSEKKN